MLYRRSLASLLGVLFLASAQPVAADSHTSKGKVDRAVRESQRSGALIQPVIISVKPGYRDALRKALQQHGDVIKSEHPLIEAVAVDLHSVDVDELANQPWIESVAADSEVSATAWNGRNQNHNFEQLQGNHPSSGSSNALRQTLGLPAAVSVGTSTSGVGVAIIDSGIAPLEDFAGRITAFYDFTRNGRATPAFDDYGHGTHIAGLIGSSGTQSNFEYQGIAPDVRFVGLKVLDKVGSPGTELEFAL